MNSLSEVLEALQRGDVSLNDAQELVKRFSFETHSIGTIDQHRSERTGVPEVVYAEGKETSDVVELFETYRAENRQLIATRVRDETRAALGASYFHDEVGNVSAVFPPSPDESASVLCVVSAGASDRPVAKETVTCAALFGLRVTEVHDVGVAGLARMTQQLDRITDSDVITVVAGMDGALPSVIAGLVKQPVIAVPTSVGYGAAFSGLAALLSMLNACAPGVLLVNIDNGFGAAAAAKKMLG